MADFWELICHHTYSGVPGVVVDRSPVGASHGRAWNLNDSNFQDDGASIGSGCVNFGQNDSFIEVKTDNSVWHSLSGIKGEAVICLDEAKPGWKIIATSPNDGSFHFGVSGDLSLHFWFHTLAGWGVISTKSNSTGPSQYQMPLGRWITLSFLHDGLGRREIHADGEIVASANHSELRPLAQMAIGGLRIGRAEWGGHFPGRIDDLKIWRVNPLFVEEQFLSRPVDSATADCWKRFFKEIEAAFQRHPQCAEELAHLLRSVLDELTGLAIANDPEAKLHLARSAREYDRLWRTGQVNSPKMVKVFSELIDWMRNAGINVATTPTFLRLINSECLSLFLSEIKPPDCDLQVAGLLKSIQEKL